MQQFISSVNTDKIFSLIKTTGAGLEKEANF